MMQDMISGMGNGSSVALRSVIASFAIAHNRDNPLKTYGGIRAPLPLDAPACLDGTMSRVEIVSESLWA